MQIDWLTVIAQIVNFLILVWLLKRFLYQPVINAMAKREERIGARLSEAQQREDEADAERRRFQEKTEEFERARDERLAAAREAAEKEKRQRLDEARHEIDHQRQKWREELRREQDELHKALRRELAGSAIDIARRALADLADATLEHRIAATLLRELENMPEKEREAFARAKEPLRLAASFDLDDETRERLRVALAARSGIEFVRDPDLVCGFALTGAGHRLDWNLNDYLDDAAGRFREQLATSATDDQERA